MVDVWHETLKSAGLERHEDGGWSFPGHRGGDDAGLTPLLDRAWIKVTGSDAEDFLHGQVSADLKSLKSNRMQPAAYCSPQGRVLATPRFLPHTGDWLVELPAGIADSFLQRLRLYVLRADVKLGRDDRIAGLGIWGKPVQETLERWTEAPVKDFDYSLLEDLLCVRLPGTVPRFQLLGPRESLAERFEALAERLSPGGDAVWRLLDIEAGVPDVVPATAGHHLPQSLGLERWDALNYRKGCYPGQEVIARLYYRGRLKRHLFRATTEGEAIPPGTQVIDANGREMGEVLLSAAFGETPSARLLAVLRESALSADCRACAEGNPALTDMEQITGPVMSK